MIRTILQLTSFGNQQSRWRTLGIVFGIAVGVGLLLTLLGAAQGLTDRQERSAWLSATRIPIGETNDLPFDDNSVILARFFDYIDGDAIERMDVASKAGSTITTPWNTPLPEPGAFYASPAMIELIDRFPADQLGDRYGTLVGEIPSSALQSPDSIVVLVGRSESDLQQFIPAVVRPSVSGESDGANPVYQIVMIIGGLAMFIPVLLLISTTTQLGGAERSERLATLRLIGATPQSLTLAAAAEMAVIALAGSISGVVGWWLLRPVGTRFRIDDGRFFASDLDLTTATLLLVVLGTVIATSIAAGLRIASMGIGPLGGARERIERTPSAIRIVPLLAGLGLFAAATVIWDDANASLAFLQLATIGGFVLAAIGLLWAGPWLTRLVSRCTDRLSGSAAGVIASGRIHRHPNATFRSVSGLVLAVFFVSVFAGAASSVLEADDPEEGEHVFPLSLVYVEPAPGASDEALAALTIELEAIPGVTRAMIARSEANDLSVWLVPSEDAPFANVPASDDSTWTRFYGYHYIWPGQVTDLPGVDTLPASRPVMILVANDGRPGVVDTVRTTLDRSGLVSALASTRPDSRDTSTRAFVNSLANLAYIGIAITILIAGISLTVATAVSMLERKRVFGLMRLMGMPNAEMNRIVAFEAIAPLVAVLALSIGAGFLIAWMMIEGLSYSRSLHAPDLRFYLAILGSLALAIVSVLTVTGLVRRHTEINQTRFE